MSDSPTDAAAAVGARATRREWIGLAVIALPCMLYSMDLTVLNLALPTLSAELQPSATELLWIIDIYGFMVAGLLVTMGTLGDRIGRRRLLMIGAAAFGAASVLAAFAQTAAQLIALRALLGMAGATVAPSTLSLIRNMFHDPRERTTAIGVWISSYSIGAAIGPVLGGVLLAWFHWGSVFLINVPVMALLLVLAPRLLPEYRDPAARRMDVVSAALSLAAVLATIYGIKHWAEDGLHAAPLVAIGAGLLIGAVFVWRQRRLVDPLFDLRLFGERLFSASLAIYLLACLVMFGFYIFIGQYLQLVLGLSPLHAGFWTVPWALSFVLGSMLTPRLHRRLGAARLVAGGLVMAAGGLALMTLATATSTLLPLVSATVVMSFGLAPVFTLATDLVVGSVPVERAGAASAVSETCAEFGGALGIALFGSLGTALYRSALATPPPGVPAEVAEIARSTLGAAVPAAQALAGEAGTALLQQARGAFIEGLHAVAVTGSGLMLATALLAALSLRAQVSADTRTP